MAAGEVVFASVTGRGRRVVLVHGFTQTGRTWGAVADNLSRDHEVVLVDAPGHGSSADVRADLVGGADLIGDAGGRATYAGYSMGGRFTLHLALARPDLVQALALISASAGIDDAAERARRRRDDEALARRVEADGVEAFVNAWLAQPLFAGLAPEVADVASRLANTPAGLASSLRLAGVGTQEPLWDRLAELAMPVVVMAGERDARYRELAERLAAGVGGNASVVTVEDAGHAAHLENPGQVADVVRELAARSG